MKHILLIISVLMVTCLSAQEAKFSVDISTDSLLMGNYVEVTFTLENAQARNFEPPTFTGFRVVSGPNQSSSFSMVNGTVSQSIAYSYYLEPSDIGNYYIEPASIETETTVLETVAVELIVHPNPDGIQQHPKKRSRQLDFWGRDDPFFAPRDRPKLKPKKKRKTYKL